MINRLAHDPQLHLYSFTESVGISRNIDYLKPTLLARGAFDLRAVRPPQDVAMVGAVLPLHRLASEWAKTGTPRLTPT